MKEHRLFMFGRSQHPKGLHHMTWMGLAPAGKMYLSKNGLGCWQGTLRTSSNIVAMAATFFVLGFFLLCAAYFSDSAYQAFVGTSNIFITGAGLVIFYYRKQVIIIGKDVVQIEQKFFRVHQSAEIPLSEFVGITYAMRHLYMGQGELIQVLALVHRDNGMSVPLAVGEDSLNKRFAYAQGLGLPLLETMVTPDDLDRDAGPPPPVLSRHGDDDGMVILPAPGVTLATIYHSEFLYRLRLLRRPRHAVALGNGWLVVRQPSGDARMRLADIVSVTVAWTDERGNWFEGSLRIMTRDQCIVTFRACPLEGLQWMRQVIATQAARRRHWPSAPPAITPDEAVT